MKNTHIEIYDFDKLTIPMLEAIDKGDVQLAEEYRTQILDTFREEVRRVCKEVLSRRNPKPKNKP